MIPDESLSLSGGAVLPWRRMVITDFVGRQDPGSVAERYGFGIDRPFRDLSDEARQIVLFGYGGERRSRSSTEARNGNIRTFRTTSRASCRTWRGATARRARERSRRDRALHDDPPCPTCEGMRLKPGVAVGHGRGREHHPDHAPVGDRCAGLVPFLARAPDRSREPDRPPGAGRRSDRLRFLIDVGPRLPDPDPRERHALGGEAHASGWRPRSGRASWACSTSSTSRRSGCTSATTTG